MLTYNNRHRCIDVYMHFNDKGLQQQMLFGIFFIFSEVASLNR